ncbi:hypothetical protein AB0M48_38945 [Lentzea sp. NPDC051208]|uniref:hypothetical protein n=1 Tax=Lentzea sp. NPDC051208 TaxID=3154642 RepID=UPI00341FB8C6
MSQIETTAAEAATSVWQDVDPSQAQKWFDVVCSAYAECLGEPRAFNEVLGSKAREASFERACETFLAHLDREVADPVPVLAYLYEHQSQLGDWYAALLNVPPQIDDVDVFRWVDADQERLLTGWSPTWRADLAAYLESGWGADWPSAFGDDEKHAWLSGWLSAVQPPESTQEQATPTTDDTQEAATAATQLLDELGAAIPGLAAELGITPAELVAVLDEMDINTLAEAAADAVSTR